MLCMSVCVPYKINLQAGTWPPNNNKNYNQETRSNWIKITLNLVVIANTSKCVSDVLPSIEPDDHIIGELEILPSEFSAFGVWDKLFLLPLLMLIVGSTPVYLNALYSLFLELINIELTW